MSSEVQHFRFPFCREYPINPQLQQPPTYYDSTNYITGVTTRREVYVPCHSTLVREQMDADALFGRILKVSMGILGLLGLVVLGYYLGKKT